MSKFINKETLSHCVTSFSAGEDSYLEVLGNLNINR